MFVIISKDPFFGIMSCKNRRVVISLNNFFNDHRSMVLIFINRRMRCIRDLEEHVEQLFGISDFYFMSGNRYLPSSEDVKILQLEEVLRAVPKFQTTEDSRKLPSSTVQLDTCPVLPQMTLDITKDSEQNINGMLNQANSFCATTANKVVNVLKSPELIRTEETEPHEDIPSPSIDRTFNCLNNVEAKLQKCMNTDDSQVCTTKSPSTAIVDHIFDFFERSEIVVHDENINAVNNINAACEQPQPDKMECSELETVITKPRFKIVDSDVKSLNSKKCGGGISGKWNTTNFCEREPKTVKVEDASVKNSESVGNKNKVSINVLENQVFTPPAACLGEVGQGSKREVDNKEKLSIAEEPADNVGTFKTRHVTSVKRRKTNLICLDLPKQTNIVKSLIVSSTPKKSDDHSELETLHGSRSKSADSRAKPEAVQLKRKLLRQLLAHKSSSSAEEISDTGSKVTSEGKIDDKQSEFNGENKTIDGSSVIDDGDCHESSDKQSEFSVQLSNSESIVSKRKRKRHRKCKRKDRETSYHAVDSECTQSFKTPSTIVAPSVHIRFGDFEEENVVAGEEMELEHREDLTEEKRDAGNDDKGEIDNDMEEEMLERVVRQSPCMTKTLPRPGDVISFKFLRMNDNYEPEISKTVIGKVLNFVEDTDEVCLQLISGLNQCREPDGKFSLEDEAVPTTEKRFLWKSLLEARLLFP